MIKNFCDGCGNEITQENREGTTDKHSRFIVERKFGKTGETLRVECITSKNGVANYGDWCRFCIIDAVDSLDTRPKAAHE